jgi:DNA-binding FadR family transcriptional regulator
MTRTTRSAPAIPSSAQPDDAKLAQRIARLIEKEVVESGWQVGSLIGSETELAARFGVSRTVMREAVSITEHDGLIVSCRGRRGGLRIAAPALEAVSKSVRNYLHYASIDLASILDARLILENLMIDIVSRSMRAEDYASIKLAASTADPKRSLRTQIDLLRRLLDIGGNPALAVFFISLIDLILMKMCQRDIPDAKLRKFNEESSALRLDYVAAMYGLNLNRAHFLAHELNDKVCRLLESGAERAPADEGYPLRIAIEMMVSPSELPLPHKGAELLTHRLHREIVRRNWPIGTSLGTESELLERFDVGRNVLREAIRPLERIGVVQMRQRVGLVIHEPDPAATVRSVVLYLNHAGLTRDHIYAVQNELELAGAGDLAGLPDTDRTRCAQGLRAIIDLSPPATIRAAQDQVRQFYLCFIAHLPNRVIALFLQILCDLVTLAKHKSWSSAELNAAWGDIRTAQQHFIETLMDGDRATARRSLFQLKAKLDVLLPTHRPLSEIVS